MKKIIKLFTICVLAFSLIFVASCGKKDKGKQDPENNDNGGTTPVVEPVENVNVEETMDKVEEVAGIVINNTDKAKLTASASGTLVDLTTSISYPLNGTVEAAAVLGSVQEIDDPEGEPLRLRVLDSYLLVNCTFGAVPISVVIYELQSGVYTKLVYPNNFEELFKEEEADIRTNYEFEPFDGGFLLPELASMIPASQLSAYLELAQGVLEVLPVKTTKQGSTYTIELNITEENFAGIIRQFLSIIKPDVTKEEMTGLISQIAGVISVTHVDLKIIINNSSIKIDLATNAKVMNYRVNATAAVELKLGEGEVNVAQTILDEMLMDGCKQEGSERYEYFITTKDTDEVKAADFYYYDFGCKAHFQYDFENKRICFVSVEKVAVEELEAFSDAELFVEFDLSGWNPETPIYAVYDMGMTNYYMEKGE